MNSSSNSLRGFSAVVTAAFTVALISAVAVTPAASRGCHQW